MTTVRTGQSCSTPPSRGSNVNLETVLNNGNDGGGEQIKNIADPTDDQDAATKKYVDDEISESQHYRGVYATLVALQAAVPTGNPGDYADVDAGVGTDVQRYIWDDDDEEWIEGGSGSVGFIDLSGVPGDNPELAAALALKLDKLITANRQTASYTLALTDLAKLVEMNVASANNLTVPPNSSVAFEIGTQLFVSQYGAGQTTIVAGSGVTINSSSGVLTIPDQYSVVSLVKIGTNEWYLWNGSAFPRVMATMTLHATAGTVLTINPHPNSEQSLVNSAVNWVRFDATIYTQIRGATRVVAGSSSVNSPRLYPQYTTDLTGASGWTTIGAGTVLSGEAISLAATAQVQTSWIDLPAGAKADVLFRLAQNGGNGAQQPTVCNVYLHFRR